MDLISEILVKSENFLRELPPMPPSPVTPKGREIAAYIDHTLLKSEATPAQIEKLCAEADEFHFASVCVNPVYVPLAYRLLKGTQVKICTVVGFPLGANLASTKQVETLACLASGASEIDMVLYIGGLKGGDYQAVLADILGVTEIAHAHQAIVKVILETSALSHSEKIIACLLCQSARVDFVKTSTGFGAGGATVDDVELMYRLVSPEVKVKASGGIRTLKDSLAMIQAGASRLGTSSGVQIIKEAHERGGRNDE